MNNFNQEKSLWERLLFVLEQIMIYFPVVPYIFLLLLVILWNLSLYSDKIRDYTVLIFLFIFLPLFSAFILIKKKEFGAYLRTIGIIIYQFLIITFGSPRFLHQAVTINWSAFQYAIYFVFWYFSFFLIILGLISDLRSVFIRRTELSKNRKWFSVLYIFLIIFLILYLGY